MRSSPRFAGKAAGFTLLEVLVAFVVLGFALTALYGQFFTGLRSLRGSDGLAEATRLARNRLAVTGIETALVPGEATGAFANGFTWRQTVVPYRGELALPQYGAVRPFEVTVSVTVPGAGAPAVALTELRLLPAGGPR
ncbi:prepilin-type N-terminal cleavage/methylation domain-containing protein [Pelagibius sp. 7325]|uniref:type IV pilus modification PilV family protein n=1 Tax=Pelagibius sp. 7325 TaxID=3131994 RepID=UPI0030EC3F1E